MGVKAFDASRTFFSREKPFQNKGLSFGGGWWRRAAGDVSGGWLTLWIKMWRMARRLWRKWSRRPVSRVLSLPCGRGQPFLWDARCRAPLATNPDSGAFAPGRPSLFGLAPGGVYPAAPVTGGAVRSCRTVSPLPSPMVSHGKRAVCFLWHFPWGRPRRPLTGTVFPWSPDFPLRRLRAQRLPGRLEAAT